MDHVVVLKSNLKILNQHSIVHDTYTILNRQGREFDLSQKEKRYVSRNKKSGIILLNKIKYYSNSFQYNYRSRSCDTHLHLFTCSLCMQSDGMQSDGMLGGASRPQKVMGCLEGPPDPKK